MALRSKDIFLDSSMVEHSAVNRVVVGSSPTRGVKRGANPLSLIFSFGSMVKRLRHRPFTAVTRVRFPLESLKKYGLVAQLVRAPPCHGGGRRFESDRGRYGILAQLGEHLPYKQRVIGSSPIGPIIHKKLAYIYYMPMWLNWQSS